MKPTKCPASEKKMRQEKRKKKGGEKAKSKSQDRYNQNSAEPHCYAEFTIGFRYEW